MQIEVLVLSVVLSLFYGAILGAFSTVPNAQKTEGVIIERKRCDRHGRGHLFTAVVEYEVNGEKYFKSFRYASSDFSEGTKVNVIYDKTDPKTAILREKAIYKDMLLVIIIGIGAAIGIYNGG